MKPRPKVAHSVVAVLIATLLLVAGCSFGPPSNRDQANPPKLPTPSRQSGVNEGVGVQILVKNLEVPWGLAYLPDRNALVTERESGRLLQIGSGGQVSEVQRITQARSRGEGGLLGIAVSPNYDQDKTIFIYYTTDEDNRIAKLKLGEEPQPIVTAIPAADNHNGGRLAFGPDGYLYAGTGDAGNRNSAQDQGNLGGKILRMTPEGKPAPDNPFGDSLVYSYGHRNVQGLAWDSEKRLYATEFGQDLFDEINRIEAGKNYGWPITEGATTDEQFVSPLTQWPPQEASPSGATMVNGKLIVVAGLAGKRLWLLPLDDQGKLKEEPVSILENEFGRLRTVALAPDGSLWIMTSNRDGRGAPNADDDRIIRVLLTEGDIAGLV